ncbi:Exonuclease V subunit alpha [Hyphomicrobiales bacterium]|nr:Exonuclease V subunit alpha [Hyphomicrobiales bacterium]CAH1677245.1 Exonuclease V subunit alpha [Hyphomicrobiales bacterium]
MVATWNPAAASSYYLRGAEYYLGTAEPAGRWYAPAGDFELVDGAEVEPAAFERLYAGVGSDGKTLLSQRGRADRVPAFDVTFSAPRSVTLAWVFAGPDLKASIEAAQERAARAALGVVEREAMWARRGKGGQVLEPVALSAALFQHGESRPAEHEDERVFGDPNLHIHAVILNLATRADGSIGAIHSKILRDWKMAAGAHYHAALAHEMETLGFAIDRIGYNGTFELAGVPDELIRYFSARRKEIEDELAEHQTTSRSAAALASAITRATREAKSEAGARSREEVWTEAAATRGVAVESFTEDLRRQDRLLDLESGERLLAERLSALPRELTEARSVFERRDLFRAVAAALVGTGLPAERTGREVDRLLRDGALIEIGRDPIGLPRYSTAEMVAVERQVVEIARDLAADALKGVDQTALIVRCKEAGLSLEQQDAALVAAGSQAIAIIEGAPGSGKTTTLTPIVSAYQEAGYRVLGAASAWRIARMLQTDLGIEARATASWIEKAKRGHRVLDRNTVLIVDEAGLLSSRDMHAILSEVQQAQAKLILVGDRGQLQAIGAGPGLDLVSRAAAAARVETIVRQHDAWARDAVRDFGAGETGRALDAFAERGLLVEVQGARAAITAIVDRWEAAQDADPNATILLLARTNAQVGAISREVRGRLKDRGLIRGPEIEVATVTPSGHASQIVLAAGDHIRFLVRDDELGVVNGSTGIVIKVMEQSDPTASSGRRVRIEAVTGGRPVVFDPAALADEKGRVRLGWGYASSIYGSQGLTVDRALVLADPALDRHDIYVAASRARIETTLVVDTAAIDRHLLADSPLDRQTADAVPSALERRAWLAGRLSRSNVKLSTVAVIEAGRDHAGSRAILASRSRELDHGL